MSKTKYVSNLNLFCQQSFLFFSQALRVTMKKHPSCFKVLGEVAEKNNKVGDEPVILYDGIFIIFNYFLLSVSCFPLLV